MATMSGGVVERENTIEINKQVVNALMRKNEFAELSHEELTGLFTKLNAENARELTRNMNSYDPAWRNKKVAGYHYGPITGVPPGSWWGIRMDCSRDRMHDPFSASVQSGPVGAISVCTSYSSEDVDLGDVLTFTGQLYTEEHGIIFGKIDGDKEQNLENNSLILNFKNQVPIRLIRSYNLRNEFSPKTGYRYDGLYSVVDYWIGVSLANGERYYKFAFKRLSHQESAPWKSHTSRDHDAQLILGKCSKKLNLTDQTNTPLNPATKANSNDTIISRLISAKRFQSRDGKTIHSEKNISTPTPKLRPLRKRKQNTGSKTSTETKERDDLSAQEVVSTMLDFHSKKMVTTTDQKHAVSTIVTRCVSKKLQNNKVDIKLPSDCADKPAWDICPRNEAHQQNDDGEDDSLKSPGSRLQNTNISIRTDLYDSSHNLKDHVKKRGTIITHGGGVFKPRILGVPRRQLHFAGADSSPRSNKTITSVKMERIMSLDNSKKLNISGSNDEKDKPSSLGRQSPELVAETVTEIISRNASSNSDEHSYASPSIKSRLCDSGVGENCRNAVNKVNDEKRTSSKSYRHERRDEKNNQRSEQTLEIGLRENSDHFQLSEPSAEESPSSESPPFRGFESAGPSGFQGLWAKSLLSGNSLTMEKMLDIIAVDKTSPMAKMLIGSVIGFPTTDSVHIFHESRSCSKNQEPISQSHKEPEKSKEKSTSQNEDRLQSSKQKKWLSSIRKRSYVDLDKRVETWKSGEEEMNSSSSKESCRTPGDTVSSLNANSRQSREFRCLRNNRRENIAGMAYAEEEMQLSRDPIDSNYDETCCSTPSDTLDSNSDTTKLGNSDSRSPRKSSETAFSCHTNMKTTTNERNRNPPILKQYSNKRRAKTRKADYEMTSQNSAPESCGREEEAAKDEDSNSSRVAHSPRCDKLIGDEQPVDTVDCSSKNPTESRTGYKSVDTKDGDGASSSPNERDLEPQTADNCCLQSLSSAKNSKLNNNVCDKPSANDNIVKKGVERTQRITGSRDEHADLNSTNPGAEASSDRESYPKSIGPDSSSKKKSSEQKRLVKRSRVQTKRKIEIANLVIDMNMSPRCQISKARTSKRGGNYLRRRGCTTILDQSRKRRNVDPAKHPTSPLKRVKKNVQLQSSPIKMSSAGSSKKNLPLQRRSENRGNTSKTSDVINMSKNNSVKRMRRGEKKVMKKKPIKPKKTNVNKVKKPADIPKTIRKQDSVAVRAKKTDKEMPRRDGTVRTRSGRNFRGVAIGRLGLNRALLPGSETFVCKETNRNETESIGNLLGQPLSGRRLDSFAKPTCHYCKLPVNARKPKMVSVMTQCSLISESTQHSAGSVANVRTNNESDSRAANPGYLAGSENGSECVCSSSKSGHEGVKNEIMNLTETKSEAFDLDAASRDFEDDESEEIGRPVFGRALDRLKSHRRRGEPFARSDIQSPDKSKRLTLCSRSEGDSESRRGFTRYVASRRRRSAFVPVKSVERNFRIAQLRSIGFKPIKPGIFPPDVREEEGFESDRMRTSDSPKIIYSSGVAKRGVHEEYDKYTSEENNVVQYMDSELCYEDIENEDNACSSSDYCNEEGFQEVFVQKLDFLKVGSEAEEEEDSNDYFETRREREEEELEEDEEELELELEQDEDEIEEEAIEEEEEEEYNDDYEYEEEQRRNEEVNVEGDEEEREEEEEEEDDEVEVELDVEEFKTEEYKTEWQAQLDGKHTICEDSEQTVVDSDGDLPWHGWRKIISNQETYFEGW